MGEPIVGVPGSPASRLLHGRTHRWRSGVACKQAPTWANPSPAFRGRLQAGSYMGEPIVGVPGSPASRLLHGRTHRWRSGVACKQAPTWANPSPAFRGRLQAGSYMGEPIVGVPGSPASRLLHGRTHRWRSGVACKQAPTWANPSLAFRGRLQAGSYMGEPIVGVPGSPASRLLHGRTHRRRSGVACKQAPTWANPSPAFRGRLQAGSYMGEPIAGVPGSPASRLLHERTHRWRPGLRAR